jgi:type I restriction enzyme S subunit
VSLRLKHVASLRAGGTPSTEDGELWAEADGIPWVAISDMSDGTTVIRTAKMVTLAAVKSRNLPVGKPGSILLAMYATIGATAALGIEATWNQAILGIEPRPSMADPRFLRYWLEAIRTDWVASIRSNTQDNLNAEVVRNARFPDIPLTEQQAIAEYLDAESARIDAVIARRRAQLALLNQHFESYLDTRVRQLLLAGGTRPLKRFAAAIEQGWSPESESVSANPDEWGVLKTSAVTGGAFDGSHNKRLPPDVVPDSRWIVRDGDLLVVRGSGSPGAVGQAVIARTDGRKLLLSDLLYRVRLTSMNPEFAAFVLRSKYVRDQFEAAIRTDVGMTRKIRTEDLANVRVPATAIATQDDVARELIEVERSVAETREACDAQAHLLLERRRALTTAAIIGQLEIPGLVA